MKSLKNGTVSAGGYSVFNPKRLNTGENRHSMSVCGMTVEREGLNVQETRSIEHVHCTGSIKGHFNGQWYVVRPKFQKKNHRIFKLLFLTQSVIVY